MQIFPVVAIWGHLCGLDMTAITAIPDAVLTGFVFKTEMRGESDGRAETKSDNLGIEESWCFHANFDKIFFVSLTVRGGLFMCTFIRIGSASVMTFNFFNSSSLDIYWINMDKE